MNIFSKIYIFKPLENEQYSVHLNGREFDHTGTKLAAYSKYRSKFPSLLRALSELLNRNEVFFFDPVYKNFRVINKEKNINEAITYFYNNIDKLELNPYISYTGINNSSCMEEFLYTEL